MLSSIELLALLRLQKVPLVGDINAKRLLERCGTAEQVFKERKATLQKIDGIGTALLSGLWDTIHLEEAENELKYIQENEIEYSFFKDTAYPKHLKHCIDAPILIFKRGNINLEDRKVISIVGTRQITSYGNAFIAEFMEAIAPLDPVIVSGFAYGVISLLRKPPWTIIYRR